MNEQMRIDSPGISDARQVMSLAAPVIATQLGMMTLGFVDMLMVGRVSVDAFDAASLANLWMMGTMIFGMGVVLGIDPLVSQAHGARDGKKLGLSLQRGIIAAVLVSIPVGLSWLFTEQMLLLFGQDPGLAAQAGGYARVQMATVPAFLVFYALRQYLIGRGIGAPSMWVIVAANLLNAGLNWIFIFGNLGSPALGLLGSGIATAISRVFMLCALGALIVWTGLHHGAWQPWSRESFAWKGSGKSGGLREVFALGLPIGVQYSLEMWAFQITLLWSGWIGKEALGAHSLVLNLASMSFMIPLGVSIGAATLVGNRIGAGDFAGSRRAGRVSLVLGAGVMSLSAVLFLLFRWDLPRIYMGNKPDAAVIAFAASILPIASAFQIFDGIQVVGGGILRGMGTPRPAAWINMVGYYLLALPLSYWLAFPMGLGVRGLWWGLALGLAIIAVALIAWIVSREPHEAKAEAAPSVS